MKSPAKWSLFIIIPVVFAASLFFIFSRINRYQQEGVVSLPGLTKTVTVSRDEKGMACIRSQNNEDALMAFGFITAQDRLFQMELTRLFAAGRISELIGEKGESIDIRMRTIGFHRNAKRHAGLLNANTKLFLQKYLDGINAYIKNYSSEHPLEFKLAGIKPGPWEISDTLAIIYLMSWNSAANIDTEIIAQMLVDKVGLKRAREIFPLNINPDSPDGGKTPNDAHYIETAGLNLASDMTITNFFAERPFQIGSNNWAAAPKLSPGGKPIVANDPHLDARILPGPWYPCSIITPEFRMTGVSIPGLPGMIVGRNEYVALGVTNSYGDAQDLYIETLDPKDPSRYLEGEASIPFKIILEKLTIKDAKSPGGIKEKEVKIRLSRRGPIISGVLSDLKTKKVITLRWAPFETMGASLGIEHLMGARSMEEVRRELRHFDIMMLNFVFADKKGNIGWIASGKLPIRSQGDGTLPYKVRDGRDNWGGWIPFEKMPQRYNPERGWLGTCNHNTIGKDYPYYYSSHLSPSYRYRRLIQLMENPGKKTVDDHWKFQRDTVNMMARKIVPVMAKALTRHADTKELGGILLQWNFTDDPALSAPTLFQAIYREFAFLVFEDELGKDLAMVMLRNWYFWQERLQQMVLGGTSAWFDDIRTVNRKESRDDLFHKAALIAAEKLRSSLGGKPVDWKWGKIHSIEFVSPIRREGFGKSVIGGGSFPFPGSGETLHRAIYDFKDPFKVTVSASLRMVADLNDDDKVLAVLPGGVSGRIFHPHATDQLKAFIGGDQLYWWFSDKAIQEHAKAKLVLKP